MNDSTQDHTALVAGGVPDAAAQEEDLDATLPMNDEEWLEHALGDLHSSAWTMPSVEL